MPATTDDTTMGSFVTVVKELKVKQIAKYLAS